MSEIEKMYEKCNFEKSMGVGSPVVLHPFTAEKQIKLIKWLALRDGITIVAYIGGIYSSEHDKYNVSECSLESCLARLINNLWKDLIPEEKQQVKGILE